MTPCRFKDAYILWVTWWNGGKNTWHKKYFQLPRQIKCWSGVFSLHFHSFYGNILKLCFCWNLKHRAIPTCCLSLGISLPGVLTAISIEATAGSCGPWHHRNVRLWVYLGSRRSLALRATVNPERSHGWCDEVRCGKKGRTSVGGSTADADTLLWCLVTSIRIHLLHGQWFLLPFLPPLEKHGIGQKVLVKKHRWTLPLTSKAKRLLLWMTGLVFVLHLLFQ